MKLHHIHLSSADSRRLHSIVHTGTHPARFIQRARILLKAADRLRDRDIAEHLNCTTVHVANIRKRYCMGGLDRALHDAPRSGKPPTFTGAHEAQIVALACNDAPDGASRWTLKLLAEKAKENGIVETISPQAVWLVLERQNTKPWRKKMWCIPKLTPEFKERMEDLLVLYAKPYDPREPVVCLDENSKQLLGDSRPGLPTAPGKIALRDYEYVRKGTANIFVWVEPLAGRRFTEVTKRRTKIDYALFVEKLIAECPDAKTLHLVQDKLNTHTIKSLIEAFGIRKAKRLWKRLTVHYTPKHASSLDMAEIEINALSTQCLDRRIASIEELRSEVAACTRRRNEHRRTITGTFTTEKAKEKFSSLYSNGLCG